jgi:2-dehydropantoate 2-reductase
MRFVVLGAGALGSVFGARLALAGHEVTLVDVNAAHMDAIGRDGLVVERPDGGPALHSRPRATTVGAEAGEADAVIVLTKGWATRDAAESIRGSVGPGTWVMTLMNGLGHDRVLGSVLGAERVLPGTTTVGAELLEPGRVRMSQVSADGSAITHLGPPRTAGGVPDGVVALAAVMTRAQLRTEAVADADTAIWTKLTMAASMAPLSAVVGRTIRDIWAQPSGRALLRDLFDEIVAVAAADGTVLDAEATWQHCASVWETDRGYLTSMAMDVREGRRTEIDSFSLELVRRAGEHGLDAPVSATIGRLVQLAEATAIAARRS